MPVPLGASAHPHLPWRQGFRGFYPCFRLEIQTDALPVQTEMSEESPLEEMNNMDDVNNNPAWKPEYREACGIVTTYRGEKPMILVVRRSALEDTCQGLWEVAGGKVDEGETIYWTARTELLEETGLDRSPTYMTTHYDHTKAKAYHLFVDAHVTKPEVTLSFEHDEYKWISLGELRAWVNDSPDTISHHLAHWVNDCIDSNTLHGHFTYTTIAEGVPFSTWSTASWYDV